MNLLHLLFSLSLILYSAAQTLTTTNAAGASVVVVVSTDPAGINPPVTQTIQTLAPGAPPVGNAPANTATTTSPTTTSTTTPVVVAPVTQGPVAQPAPAPQGAGGVTPFTYTTVINGVTTAIQDNFTPTNPGTTPFTPTKTGTIWNYSQYTSVFGPPSGTPNGAMANSQKWALDGFTTMMACLFTILIL